MKKIIARAMLSVALVGGMAAVAGITAPTVALAAKGPSVSAAVGKQLMAAQTAIQAKDFATAQASLNEAKAATGRTAFDDFKIGQFQINISLNMNDHPGAFAAAKSILDYPDPQPQEAQQLYSVALGLSNELNDPATGVKAGSKLIALGVPLTDVDMAQLATAYYFSKDNANAKIWAQKAIDTAAAANQPPNQAALQIMQNIASDSHDNSTAIASLQKIVLYYHRPDDWAQLIGVSYAPKTTDAQVIQVRRLQLLLGVPMDAGEYADAGRIQLKGGYPGEAARFLSAGVSAGKVKASDPDLAQARAKAAGDEKSLAANDAAAAKSAGGDLDTLVAEQYYGYGRYAEAETAAARAVSKGGRKGDPTEAPLVLGMAQAAQGKFADAQATFGKVPQSNAETKNIVALWILYCQTKLTAPKTGG